MSKTKQKFKGPAVQCPMCRRKQPKRGGHDTIYWCDHCRAQFDDQPEEGGSYSDTDPSWRIQQSERRQGR